MEVRRADFFSYFSIARFHFLRFSIIIIKRQVKESNIQTCKRAQISIDWRHRKYE